MGGEAGSLRDGISIDVTCGKSAVRGRQRPWRGVEGWEMRRDQIRDATRWAGRCGEVTPGGWPPYLRGWPSMSIASSEGRGCRCTRGGGERRREEMGEVGGNMAGDAGGRCRREVAGDAGGRWRAMQAGDGGRCRREMAGDGPTLRKSMGMHEGRRYGKRTTSCQRRHATEEETGSA